MRSGKILKFWVLFAACFYFFQCYGATLVWDSNQETNLAGYYVYCESGTGEATVVDVGTSTSYPLTNLTNGKNYSLYVTAYNVEGVESDPSQQVTYTVPAAPVIVSQPSNQSVIEGESFSLAVGTTNSTGVSVQWYFNGSALTGATNSVFAVPVANATHAGSYNVIATNAGGSATSSTAVVTVMVAPRIITPSMSQVVIAGSSFTLPVEWSGTAPATFAWFHNDVLIPGAAGPNLEVSAVTAADAGTYRVEVSNPAGSAAAQIASIEVVETPVVRLLTSSQSVIVGNSFLLSAESLGSGTLHYQWYRNDTPIAGANVAQYEVSAATLYASGNYTVAVSNEAGTTTSAVAVVKVRPPSPAIPENFEVFF